MAYICLVPADPTSGAAVSLESFIDKARGGDSSAFEEIVRRYEGLVLRLARRMTGNREDSLDVAQESFLRIYKSLRRFRSGSRFESWVYRIVVHASWDLLRQRRSLALVALETDRESDVVGELPDPRTPEGEAARAQFREKLDGLLDELSPRLRAVFVLRDIEGLPTGEIAAVLGCRQVTVRRHSMEAREKIRTLLNRRFPALSPERKA